MPSLWKNVYKLQKTHPIQAGMQKHDQWCKSGQEESQSEDKLWMGSDEEINNNQIFHVLK